MTPQATTTSPHTGRNRLRTYAVAAVALLGLSAAPPIALVATPPAFADLVSITTRPAEPSTCDSVGLLVAGFMPDPCYRLIGAELEGPIPLPTMGPIPTYEIRVRMTVQEPNPALDIPCPTVLQPYQHAFRLGLLPFGQYWVRGVEYLVPFSPDSTGAPKDSSLLSVSFSVRPVRDPCSPHAGCYFLDFAARNLPEFCNGSGPPGGTACIGVSLHNEIPVGGVQTAIVILDPRLDPSTPLPSDQFEPVSVELTERAAGFEVLWTAEGSRTRLIIFSPSGGTIAPGRGPVARVCYAISSDATEGASLLHFRETIVADSNGNAIPACPTLVEPFGRLCVVRSDGCDVNGDGRSNILDIIRIVRCALANRDSTDACPDSVAAKADCNGDGSVDIRDVICCVRKILAAGGFNREAPAGTGSLGVDPTRIGFVGPVRWITPLDGRATIEIVPGTDFAGIQFGVGATGGVKIRALQLDGSELGPQMEWGADAAGGAGAILYRLGNEVPASTSGAAAVAPIRVEVLLEPNPGASGAGRLEITGSESGTWDAASMPTNVESGSIDVPQSPTAAVPMVLAAKPNPFVQDTEIAYSLPSPRRVTLRIYSPSGRLIRTLVDATMPAGVHRARWNGRDANGREAGSGIYFFKFSTGDVERTDRILRIR